MSTISTSISSEREPGRAPTRRCRRVALGPLRVEGRAGLLGEALELLDRGRPLGIAGGDRDALALLAAAASRASPSRSSCPSPAGRPSGSRSGPFEAKTSSRPEPPISSASCSLTTLTTIWPGSRLSSTPSPIAFSRTSGDEPLGHLEVDVRLEQREADLAHRLVDVGLAQLPARAQVGERPLEAVGELVEHGPEAYG